MMQTLHTIQANGIWQLITEARRRWCPGLSAST